MYTRWRCLYRMLIEELVPDHGGNGSWSLEVKEVRRRLAVGTSGPYKYRRW